MLSKERALNRCNRPGGIHGKANDGIPFEQSIYIPLLKSALCCTEVVGTLIGEWSKPTFKFSVCCLYV